MIVLGAAISAAALVSARSAEEERIQALLDFRADWHANDIENYFKSSFAIVLSVATMVATTAETSAAPFDSFVIRRFSYGHAHAREVFWAPRARQFASPEARAATLARELPESEITEREGDRPRPAPILVGDSFWGQAIAPEAAVMSGEREVRDGILPPGTVGMGRYRLRLSHQRFPALILFDPQGPHVKDAVRQDWFAYDPRYRFEATLAADASPDTVIIQSTRGNERRALRMGVFELALPTGKARLEAHRLLEPGVGEADVSVFFRDATSDRETYGVGRYVDPEAMPDGRWSVDLNHAYNPACAFSPHYNCPIPSKANTLKVAVRAGEKSPTGVTGH